MIPSTRSCGLRGLIAAAILASVVLSSAAASAADSSSAGITVKYADLNLASPAGALVLYGRIQAAARSACAYFWFKTDADEARCVRNTIAHAVTQVNAPALSAIYDEKFPISAPSSLVSQSH
jgi:UrcA family protein